MEAEVCVKFQVPHVYAAERVAEHVRREAFVAAANEKTTTEVEVIVLRDGRILKEGDDA